LPYSVHVVRVATEAPAASAEGGAAREWAVVAPKGRQVNELKVKAHLLRHALAPPGEIVDITVRPAAAADAGARPVVLVDESLVAAEAVDAAKAVGDFTLTEERDGCAEAGCEGELVGSRGIEVGHVFYLGTKYSAKLDARVATPSGTNYAEMVHARVCGCACVRVCGG
jgi:prolyl-tRNA synthetase